MCGIVGSVNTPINERVLELIKHRGPDSRGLIEEEVDGNNVYFGHTRLSIVDLSEAGCQPMYSDCGNYCITFNGEIYNHSELRKRLKGIAFRSHSDTETILYYIREYGIEAIKDFNGIFAFGFLDKIQKKLFLVRDQFGVKPLYYFSNGKQFVFGSELKVILANKCYTKEIDLHSLDTLLSFRYNPAPQTIFKHIYKLKAANYLTFSFNGKIEERKYWNRTQKINYTVTAEDAVEEYRRLLQQAVKRQLLGDVPVGLLLSGGLDSAVLGFLLSKFNSTPIKTFTVGFEGKGDFNETEYAKETAAFIKADHHYILINKKKYLDLFYKSFYHVEEPIAEPTIPALYSVSALASQYVKVVMSGQGIDEPMAGYKRYRGEQFLSKYKNILDFIPVGVLRKAFPTNHGLARAYHAMQYKNELDRFIGIFTLYTNDLKNEIYRKEVEGLKINCQKHYFIEAFSNADNTNGSLSKLLFIDTRSMLPDNLLLFNDKITMANSIENRVPYLDLDLINFIESLPVSFKLKGKTGKYLHREAVKKWIPRSIIDRKKRGFSTPIDRWFQDELAFTLDDLISSRDSFSNRFFNISVLKKIISDHRNKKHNYKHELFILLSLELWYKDFYKKF
jgi:asparagine synthase (glutamine-hydrolysing)